MCVTLVVWGSTLFRERSSLYNTLDWNTATLAIQLCSTALNLAVSRWASGLLSMKTVNWWPKRNPSNRNDVEFTVVFLLTQDGNEHLFAIICF